MKLQLLLSTINNRFLHRNYTLPFSNYLVINQHSSDTNAALNTHKNIYNYQEKGIAKSRNKALKKATADICLIADDDIIFLDNAQQVILETFQENPSADIITFQIQTPQGHLFKTYSAKKKWHNQLSLMRVISYEIAFKRQSIISAGLKFDERFGLQADFPTGEENIFMIDAYKKGLKILYAPVPIVIHAEKSSGKNLHDHQMISARGAVFYRMFGATAYIISLLFAIKKYPLSNSNVYRFYTLMLKGIAAYKRHE